MIDLPLSQVFALLTAIGFATSDVAARYGLRASTPISGMLMMVVMTLLMYGPSALTVFRSEEVNYTALIIFFLQGSVLPDSVQHFTTLASNV